jgi:alpha-tubulin suppressor-like RCC1 family protein
MGGAVYCWRYNLFGQLGDGTTTNRTSAVALADLASGVSKISAGTSGTCAVYNGTLRCFGNNSYGEVGIGNVVTPKSSSQAVNTLTSGVTATSMGQYFGCGNKNFSLYCWGHNQFGQLGLGHTTDFTVPAAVSLANVTAIATGTQHACAIAGGGAYCWGYNSDGAIGDGTVPYSDTVGLIEVWE